MRKKYLDNIRTAIVWIVVIYHIIYSYNNVGVINNTGLKGIPLMDSFLYFVYPWFMACLFLVAGISARYALDKRTGRQFLKSRAKRLLVPSIAGIFLTGWIAGAMTSFYTGLLSGDLATLPGIIKYLFMCMIGIGPLWFAHELFLVSAVLVLIRVIDKKDTLWNLGAKVNIPILLLLVLPVWGSSFLLNTPMIEVYRNGFYLFLFLLGYYVFSHDHVTDLLVKWKIPLLAAALITGIAYTVYYYGENFTILTCLQSPFTNIYLWIMILAILGCGKAWLNRETPFTRYLSSRSFAVYVLHYPILMIAVFLLDNYLDLPMLLIYFILLLVSVTVLPLSIEIIRKIPGLRFLLLGEGKRQKET